MKMNQSEIIEAVLTTFAEWREPLHENQEGHLVGVLLGKESALVDLIIDCQSEPPHINVAGLVCFRIPAGRMESVSRFLDLANSRITMGSFHLIRDIRMTAFGVGIDVPEDTNLEEVLIGCVGLTFTMADRWAPNIAAFAMSEETPIVAVERVFTPAISRQPQLGRVDSN
jgi:hypothetical protein